MTDAAVTVLALGRRFVEALAVKDPEALGAVLHPEVDFRALTPNRFWEAHDRDAVLEILLGVWFPADAALDELLLLTTDTVADREQVRFRFRGRNPNGPRNRPTWPTVIAPHGSSSGRGLVGRETRPAGS